MSNAEKFEYFMQLCDLNAQYAQAVDSNNWDDWIDLFTDHCEYKIQPRENYERGYPLCTLALLSKGMLRDRAFAISDTLFHDPYYQRHIISAPLITKCEAQHICAVTSYAVIRTKLSQESSVFNVGRYLDKIAVSQGTLKFESRICVYDSELIPNSLIYPI